MKNEVGKEKFEKGGMFSKGVNAFKKKRGVTPFRNMFLQESWLTQFIQLVSFCMLWKHQKTLLFSFFRGRRKKSEAWSGLKEPKDAWCLLTLDFKQDSIAKKCHILTLEWAFLYLGRVEKIKLSELWVKNSFAFFWGYTIFHCLEK